MRHEIIASQDIVGFQAESIQLKANKGKIPLDALQWLAEKLTEDWGSERPMS